MMKIALCLALLVRSLLGMPLGEGNQLTRMTRNTEEGHQDSKELSPPKDPEDRVSQEHRNEDDTGSTTAPSCYQRLTDPQGEITSPNYPSNYDNNQECMYLIEGAPGSTIELTFLDMNIEFESLCRYDSVEVRTDDVDTLGEKFCGGAIPEVQNSSGNQMLVIFTSDFSVTGRGFRASYHIQAPPTEPPTTTPLVVGSCGGNFGGDRGSFASPNYPNDYECGQRCNYVIEVEAGRRVELTLRDFSLENHRKCRWDALEINLGDGVKVPMKLCGNTYPAASFTSLENKMELTLVTDGAVTARGFKADYRVIDL